MARFLLCRPQGGLNDIMVQIERCCQYAEKFDRTVIVDTNYKNSEFFHDTFSNYFVSKQANVVLDASPFLKKFETFSVYPHCLKGQLNEYKALWQTKDGTTGFAEKETTIPIQFDFDSEYEEDLLVRHQLGGGGQSSSLGKRMTISQTIFDELVHRLETIQDEYVAVHIRHTDMISNYHEAIDQLQKMHFINLFVATDNKAILEIFRDVFPDKKIISFSHLPEIAGQTIHHHKSQIPINVANKEAILDLFTLAFAKTFILCRTLNKPSGGYSGYSQLAQKLNKERDKLAAFLPKQKLLI